MNDLISRQEAIDMFDGAKVDEGYCTEYDIGYNDGIDFAVSKISVLKSAQQWISVSERLPEVGRNVLLSVGKGLYTAEGNLRDDGTWVQYRWSANIENVDAWAEMPEPWRGEEDE